MHARTRAGLTQADLASRTGVMESTIAAIEDDKTAGLTLGELTTVLGALGMELTVVPRQGFQPAQTSENAEALRQEFRARFVRGGQRAVRTTRGLK